MSEQLGANKDVEKMARQFRKLGGTVEVTRANHLKWICPDGEVFRTPLTVRGDRLTRQLRGRIRRLEKSGKLSRP